jgi:carboxyl-terminal processing protease
MLTWDEGVTKVTRLLPGGPADRDKRLKEGDKIVAVAQENEADVDIVGWPLEKVVRIIRGKKGTRLTLTVIPASDSAGTENARIELVRDEIKLEDHAAKGELKEIKRKDRTVKCGVIALPAFYGDVDAGAGDRNARSSARDVERVLGELKDKHADGILLDLRNNGGGSLREAVYMTGLFIEDGPVVLVRQGRSVHVIPDPDPGIVYSGPLVIVVNRGTASSSEILAGALQDYGRAVVVGDSKTHGKGSVQVIVKLAADEKLGRLKVTNALFYRISGSSTQLKGVTSDLTVPSFSEGVEAGEDYLDNPLEWSSVSRVRYPAFGDLNPVVTALDERARKRRAADGQFAVYTNLVARIDANRKTEVLPLQLAKRKAMGAIWKELRDMQKKLGGDEGEKKGDIALDESLNILTDLVEIWPFARRAEKPSRIGPAETEPSAGEISPEIEKQVEELVGQLGHDDPRVRKEARVKLKEIRKQARPALERYKEHKDPEIRATILELLKP